MKISIAMATAAALMMAGSASAQDGPQVDTMTGTLSDVKVVGGIGEKAMDYRSASWTETLSIKLSSGETIAVTQHCVGMGQPEGSLFDRHVACDGKSGDNSGSLILGCNVETVDGAATGNEMSCMGFFQGKTGTVKDHAALETAYYRFTSEGGGTVQGTSHWIR